MQSIEAGVKTKRFDLHEFSQGWHIVVASFAGVALGLTALPFYTYGVFATSLQNEFGWTRGEVQAPLLFQTIGFLMILPMVGWAGDRFGVRPVALISMLLFAIVFALFSTMTSSIIHYYSMAFLLGVVGAGTMPITWTRAINGTFEKHRGLALGFALMGSGATAFFAPFYATWLIETSDWRTAYLGLALLSGMVAFPIIFFLFKERANPTIESDVKIPSFGASYSDALHDRRFWLIAFAFLMISFGIGGAIPNLFALFTGVGMSPTRAASILSMIGVSVIVGRLVTGFMLDRFWAPMVAAILMATPAVACLLLALYADNLIAAYIATILIGFAAGAEFDIIAYLASRYFGLRHYSKIYSSLFAAFSIGAAAAPAVFGAIFDTTDSYTPIFFVTAGLFIFSSMLLLPLGPYPKFDAPTEL